MSEAQWEWGDSFPPPIKCNLQQCPKDPEILSMFVADPGHVLVHSDINALEPRVLAAFSRDPTYIKLYASGEKHDAYLYVGYHIEPDEGKAREIEAAYHEDISLCKATFGTERATYKEFHLAGMYGAGAERLYNGLTVKGHVVTLEQVQAMRKRYWERLFTRVKAFEESLLAERAERGGWIMNGRGRALAVTAKKQRDILNTFCQSTGHDLLQTFLYYLRKARDKDAINMVPWIVDVHDASIWMCPEEEAPRAKAAFEQAYAELNKEIGGDVPIIGDVEYGRCFADFKD